MSTAGKKVICLFFQVHQPFRLKRYRFFDLGHDHYYYDDYTNESILRKVADRCYLPANKLILDVINKHKGKFKVAFSLSGILIDQLRLYAPEVLESFRKLAETGSVEFLAETEAHSLASLKSRREFTRQVINHVELVKEFIGYEPQSFRNTEMIYSDELGSWVADMGFKAMLTEGAKHILGWKSPNFLYCNTINPRLKVLLRNFVLSDDIAFRFSNRSWNEWPLTADKYALWLEKISKKSELVNIFIDYETFGEHNSAESGIFDFLYHMPGATLKKTPFRFMTPSEISKTLQPVAAISVPSPISWADEERDLTAWLGNELQNAAFDKLYELEERVNRCDSDQIKKDWTYLQSSDHFYYMSTKFFSDGIVHKYFNPYDNPYEAFMNYMNVLSDFEIRLNRICDVSEQEMTLLRFEAQIKEKDEIIKKQEAEIERLKTRLGKLSAAGGKIKKTEKKETKTAEKSVRTKKKSLAEIAAEALAKSKLKKSATGVKKKAEKPGTETKTIKTGVAGKKATGKTKAAVKSTAEKTTPGKTTMKKTTKSKKAATAKKTTARKKSTGTRESK